MKYSVERISIEEYEREGFERYSDTVFMTVGWIKFLEKNQKAKPVLLKIMDENICVAVFVGGLINKYGVKILGSPFEGWLTCNMGFVNLQDYDVNDALEVIKYYAFHKLKCLYVQIVDYKIKPEILKKKIKYYSIDVLCVDGNGQIEKILEGFKPHGRRDIRAGLRKNVVEQVEFDHEFAENYYLQLEDVFSKQGLKPFYGMGKVLDISDTLNKDYIYSAQVCDENSKSVATVFSFGYGKWAYYMGAASYRTHQKSLPNEALLWSYIEYWKNKGIEKFDLVGFREYKMKYNPKMIAVPVIYFERIPGILRIKNLAKNTINLIRKIRGKRNTK